MNCPVCGAEIPSGSNLCPKCILGDPIASSTPSPGPQPASPRAVRQSAWAARVGAWFLSAVGWYFIVMFSLLTAVDKYGFLVGWYIVVLLFPLIGVTLYYRNRIPKLPMHRRVLVVSAWALLLSIITVQGNRSLGVNLTTDRVGRLAQEGAGLLPTSPDQSVWDASVRSLSADIAEFNRQYVAEAGALDQSALTGIYSAESFRDRARMEKIMSQLHAALAVDEKYSSIEPLLERMKARVRAVDAPNSAKVHFLEGITSGVGEELSKRTEITSKEKAWIQASIDLYEFTFAKKSSYFLRDEKLVFRDADVASEFDLRIKKAETLRTDFLQAKENFDKFQKERLGKLNLKPSDLGVPSETPLANKPK